MQGMDPRQYLVSAPQCFLKVAVNFKAKFHRKLTLEIELVIFFVSFFSQAVLRM